MPYHICAKSNSKTSNTEQGDAVTCFNSSAPIENTEGKQLLQTCCEDFHLVAEHRENKTRKSNVTACKYETNTVGHSHGGWLKWIMCIFLTSAYFLFTVRMRKWDTRLDHSETEMRTPLSKNSRGAWMQQQFGCKVSKNKSGSSAGLSQLWVFSSQSAISRSVYKYLAIPHISFTKYQGRLAS